MSTQEGPENIHDPFPLSQPDESTTLEGRIAEAMQSAARFLPSKPHWMYDGVLGFNVTWEDVPYHGRWLNHYVTLHISSDLPERVVGCRIEGIRKREVGGDLYLEHEDTGHPGWTPEEVEQARNEHAKANAQASSAVPRPGTKSV